MKKINISDIDYSKSNEIIHRVIKMIITSKELDINIDGYKFNVDVVDKFYLLFDTIKFITDADLLKNTIQLLSKTDFLKIDNRAIAALKNNLLNGNYTDLEKTKIESYIYSILLEFILLKKLFNKIYLMHDRKFIDFECNIDTTIISHNIDKIRENCYKMLLKHKSKNSNKNQLDKLINSMIEMDYFDENNNHEHDIKYLQHKLDQLTNQELSTSKVCIEEQNPYPLIFTGNDNKTFVLFDSFCKQHILDKYIDFSFLFQQMKFNGYIRDIKHLNFMKWLYQNNYLTQNEYSVFIIERSFRSLKKCAFGTRVDLYLKLQKSIIHSNSDLSE